MSSEILLSFGGGCWWIWWSRDDKLSLCYRRDVTNEKESSTAMKCCIKKKHQNRVLVSIVTGFRER